MNSDEILYRICTAAIHNANRIYFTHTFNATISDRYIVSLCGQKIINAKTPQYIVVKFLVMHIFI